MKKLLPVCVLLLFLFCACSPQAQNSTPTEINRNFTAKAQIDNQGTTYTAEFQSTESGCSVVFYSPKEFNGLKISYINSEFTYSFAGIEFTSPPKTEIKQFVQLFHEAAKKAPEDIKQNETGYNITGKVGVDSHTYYMNINKEQLTPTFFEIDELDLTVKFF